jgi:predicted MFS family arabinose efflux permease
MLNRPVILLWLLAAANFVVGIGAFVVIGVLSPVSAAFAVDSREAAWLMTLYAIVYAVSSPVLVALTGARDRSQVLSIGMAIFAIGAVLGTSAPSFAILLAARVLMAIGGGLLTPVAASVGVTQLPSAERGRALAIVFGGLTLAQVVGVPAGAWLGYTMGWRSAFALVALLAASATVMLWQRVPRGLQVPVTTLVTLGQVLRTPRLLIAIAFTALFIGGLYTIYTFLAPLLETRLHMTGNGVTLMLALFGAGAVVGNAMGGVLTDRIGAVPTLALLSMSQVLLMPLLSGLTVGAWVMGLLIVVWSVFAWSFMVPQQARLAALDPPRTPVLFALNAAAIYVGGSLGSVIGGQTLKAAGFQWLGVAGAVLALASGLSLWLVPRAKRTTAKEI